jgi:hypothetical protein
VLATANKHIKESLKSGRARGKDFRISDLAPGRRSQGGRPLSAELPRESKDAKGSSIDIVCKAESGEFILVQMQERPQDFIAARTEMEAAKG